MITKQNHWIIHRGKCGICGDAWQRNRDNEAGGRYANALVSRRYQAGQVINVTVQLTENLSGHKEMI